MSQIEKTSCPASFLDELTFKQHSQPIITTAIITLVTSGLFLIIGLSIDYYFATKPAGIIISMIVGLPLTQFLIFYTQRKYAIDKINTHKNDKR